MSAVELAGMRVVILGLGASGRSAARLCVEQGAQVLGLDLRTDVEPLDGVELELGPHRREAFLQADLVVVSPGIPARIGHVQAALDAGVTVLGELALAASLLDQPMVAITGTNGKSTTTWFTGQLLEAAGMRPFVGGNLGNPLSEATREPGRWDALVVEVSSYQMELAGSFHPAVGLILNLTPDHLRRHGTMEVYGEHKCRIFDRMQAGDLAVLPAGDALLERLAAHRPGTRAWLGGLPGYERDGERILVRLPGVDVELSLAGFGVQGEHNRDNAAAAALCALALGADPAAVQAALPGLRPLPHRMEEVPSTDGLVWLNDSKATNLDAARVGIAGVEGAAVVLLGGEAKDGDDFGDLAPLLQRHRAVVCFGGDGPSIHAQLVSVGLEPVLAGGMGEAVALARGLARPGDAVLLSPGCASFDEFDNFEHRGRVFRTLAGGG